MQRKAQQTDHFLDLKSDLLENLKQEKLLFVLIKLVFKQSSSKKK